MDAVATPLVRGICVARPSLGSAPVHEATMEQGVILAHTGTLAILHRFARAVIAVWKHGQRGAYAQ